MEDIKLIMNQASGFLDRVASIYNRDGRVLASTNAANEGESNSDAMTFFSREKAFGITDNASYKLIMLANGDDYVCSVEGTDQTAGIYLELLSAWVTAGMADGKNEADRESFLKNILLDNELPGDIPLKAREYRIAYNAKRVAFLIHIMSGDSMACVKLLQRLFPNRKADFILPMDEENAVLLKELGPEEAKDIAQMAERIMEAVNEAAGLKVRIGVGTQAEVLKDCAKSYREASLSLTVGSIFESDNQVMRYEKLGLGRLIYQLPPTLCQMFLEEVFPDNSYETLDGETLRTINKFFENNLNGSETSRQLFVHRNTLVYRLDKVQKITNLDLRNFDDAVLFKLATMVRKYLEGQMGTVYKPNARWWGTQSR